MDEMEIKSGHSSARLRFFDIQGDYFHASLTSLDYSGTVAVWAYTDSKGLADLFMEMAKNWQGWSGAKKWVSLEKELTITCTSDKLGHISLDIILDNENLDSDEPWCLLARIVIYAGQLEKIAQDAKEFFKGAVM